MTQIKHSGYREQPRQRVVAFLASLASRTDARAFEAYLDELTTWIIETKVTSSIPPG